MKAYVVDTNVAVAANGKAPRADKRCELSCTKKLASLSKARVCVDVGGLIIGEYRKHLSPKGQPGLGDLFMKWLLYNQYTPSVCERVAITPHSARGFMEFPSDQCLASFHHDDRKFVAVALASQYSPTILNAVDSDWSNHQSALNAHGVRVEELCPDCLSGSCNG